jgi:hypothetical protein
LISDMNPINPWFNVIIDNYRGNLSVNKSPCSGCPYILFMDHDARPAPRLADVKLRLSIDKIDKKIERAGHVSVYNAAKGPNLGSHRPGTSMTGLFRRLQCVEMVENDSIAGIRYGQDLRFWLVAKAISMIKEEAQSPIIDRMYRLYECGYCPIEWVGTEECGYAVAWCPPDHPYREVPESCRVTPELEAAALAPVASKKVTPLPVVDEPVVPLPVLPQPPADPAAVFREWFQILAESKLATSLLDRIAARVAHLEATAHGLTVRFQPTPEDPEEYDEDFEFTSRPITLVAAPPFTGTLGPLPRSLARIVRRYNGISFGEGDDDMDAFNPYDGKTFRIKRWAYDPDLHDPDEPFRTQPLVPVRYDGEWIACHTLRMRKAKEPYLVRISHESGRPQRPIPFGIGELLLRRLAVRVLGHHIGQKERLHLPDGC